MFPVNDHLSIPLTEFEWTYARSGGPGGQNVNKVASKAQLRWLMAANTTIPEPVKARLRDAHPSRMTTDGDFLVMSQESRDQEQNKESCLEKLAEFVRRAAVVPKVRRKTKPTKGSQRRRLEGKKHAAERRNNRRSDSGD
jgi:ribosome-associated protein